MSRTTEGAEVTDTEREYIIAMQQQGMRAMTPEQMAARDRQQWAGMQNAAQNCSPDGLRNMWAPMVDIAPAQLPPLTLRQRFTQWLSRLWS